MGHRVQPGVSMTLTTGVTTNHGVVEPFFKGSWRLQELLFLVNLKGTYPPRPLSPPQKRENKKQDRNMSATGLGVSPVWVRHSSRRPEKRGPHSPIRVQLLHRLGDEPHAVAICVHQQLGRKGAGPSAEAATDRTPRDSICQAKSARCAHRRAHPVEKTVFCFCFFFLLANMLVSSCWDHFGHCPLVSTFHPSSVRQRYFTTRLAEAAVS